MLEWMGFTLMVRFQSEIKLGELDPLKDEYQRKEIYLYRIMMAINCLVASAFIIPMPFYYLIYSGTNQDYHVVKNLLWV